MMTVLYAIFIKAPTVIHGSGLAKQAILGSSEFVI
tara:strand:+ start:350 stop:454 length:105 start_codon:yes stop_codon:yes gene_type:complete